MREYKAKRKNWNELPKEDWWVYGNLLISDEQYFIVPEFGVSCIEDRKNVTTDKFIMLYAYEVDPKTVCQYTGLSDIKGNKIWENNIIRKVLRKATEPEKGIIFYDSENAAFTIRWIATKPIFSPMYPHKDGIERIRNVFDNLELLKEGKQNAATERQ